MKPSWRRGKDERRSGLGRESAGQTTRCHLLLSGIMTDDKLITISVFRFTLYPSPSLNPFWKCFSVRFSLLTLMVGFLRTPTGEVSPAVPQKVPGCGVWSPGCLEAPGPWGLDSPRCPQAPPPCLRLDETVDDIIYYDGVKLSFRFYEDETDSSVAPNKNACVVHTRSNTFMTETRPYGSTLIVASTASAFLL